jgi:hypothetical protein
LFCGFGDNSSLAKIIWRVRQHKRRKKEAKGKGMKDEYLTRGKSSKNRERERCVEKATIRIEENSTTIFDIGERPFGKSKIPGCTTLFESRILGQEKLTNCLA